MAGKAVDMDVSTDSPGSTSDSSDSEECERNLDEEIERIRESVEANPFRYDSHVKLIKTCQSSGDLDATRRAREKMAEIFPLTEELWLDWIKDEMPLIALPTQKVYMESILEKAVKDYQSVRIWLQYCQLAMDRIESSSGIDIVRDTYEKAVTAVGLHLTEGSSVWDSYREFEMELLQSYQALHSMESAGKSMQMIEQQISRVDNLFKRQLAVPLLGMDKTMETYEDWTQEPISDTTEKAYERAQAKLEKCMPFEDALSKASLPKLAEYREYIAAEVKDGDPARIQCIYERAIRDNCLDPTLWREYTEYLDNKLKVTSVALPVHERAVRNCPWIAKLWVNYIKALDKSNKEPSEVNDLFQKGLGCGFSSSDEYVELWLTYCDYMKRRVTSWSSDEDKVKELRKTFENAINYIDHYFGNEGDKSSLLRRYWAMVEAKFLNNLRKAQEIWDVIMKLHSKETHMWLEYTHFLRLHGDIVSCRRAFQRAVQTTVDETKILCEAFVSFERAEGTVEQLESAIQRTENQLKKAENKRVKEAEFEAEKAAEREQRYERQKQMKLQKNKQNRKLGKQQQQQQKFGEENRPKKDKRKLPTSTESKADEEPSSKKFKGGKSINQERQDDNITHENKDIPAQTVDEKGRKQSLNEESKEQTVFLSNLLFTIEEDDIRTKFKECGEIVDVRLARNAAGRSKGFAYLEFKDKVSAEKAMQLDRALLKGRPVFVSPCLDKAKNQQTHFRYSLSIDKHTVFVTNLPFDITKEELEDVFQKVGNVKEVRIVTNRAGKSKGYAYIEYFDEASASSAVLKLDATTVKERQINVAISKVPPRKDKESTEEHRPDHLKPLQPGSRGRAKTQLAMVPRSIHSHSATSKGHKDTSKEESTEPEAPLDIKETLTKLSNDDFRKLLSK